MCVPRTAGFAHVHAWWTGEDFGHGGRENNVGDEVAGGFNRWYACVCASNATAASWRARSGGRANDGRPDGIRGGGNVELGNGLANAGHHEDELSVREAELAIELRLDAPEEHIAGRATLRHVLRLDTLRRQQRARRIPGV